MAILEGVAWIATPLLIGAIFGLHEDAELAVYILTNKERPVSEDGAKYYVKLIQRKWHYAWIIPLVILCIFWLAYRQIYVHPAESKFGFKLLFVGVLLAITAASVFKLNILVNMIYGKDRDELEGKWKEAADDAARILDKEPTYQVVDLGEIQKDLKSMFVTFVARLFVTGVAIWFLFF